MPKLVVADAGPRPVRPRQFKDAGAPMLQVADAAGRRSVSHVMYRGGCCRSPIRLTISLKFFLDQGLKTSGNVTLACFSVLSNTNLFSTVDTEC